MIDKLAGFERAWEMKGPIIMNFTLGAISIVFAYFVVKGVGIQEDKEMQYD